MAEGNVDHSDGDESDQDEDINEMWEQMTQYITSSI